MTRTSPAIKAETISFRLEPALKAGLARSAREAHVQPAELLRELVRGHLAERERLAFEAEARRQSLVLAAAAQPADGEERQLLRELEANLDADSFAGEWRG